MPAAGELIRASDIPGLVGTPGESSAAGAGANSGTYVDYTGLSTTFTALTGHYYEVTLFIPRVGASTTGLIGGVAIREGSTVLEEAITNTSVTSALTLVCPTVLYVATFSAGAHTVKASIRLFSGTGTVTPQPAVTGAAQKCRIYVVDLGIPD